eukprot:s4625_g8.t1
MLFVVVTVALVLGPSGMPLVPLTPLQPSVDADHVELNVQYVAPDAPQPQVQADADLTIPMSATIRQMLAEVEHTGCSSGVARGVLVVCSQASQPQDCLTTRPAALGPPGVVAMMEDDPIEDYFDEDPDPIEQFSSEPASASVPEAVSGADVVVPSSDVVATAEPSFPAGSGVALNASSQPGLLPPISVLDILPLVPITSPASPSSACGSLSTASSTGLSNSAANMLLASEQERLRALAMQIHNRLLQARSAGSSGHSAPHYLAANWITSLRYMASAMQAFPVPPGSEGAFMAPVAEADAAAEDDTELNDTSADPDL